MDKYDKAIKDYVKMFGDTRDINEYVSTWEYTEKDFEKLAEQLKKCIKNRKRYSKLYVSLFKKFYYKTIYKFLNFEE
ncbi:MAG: hypothetical protein IJE59_02915 [Clostridia bacterium]|nr:hypothetical protein [Clostridia bacterium]